MAVKEFTADSRFGPAAFGAKWQAEIARDKPLAYWTMDEPSGTTITDKSGNGRNGTYSGATLAQTTILSPEISQCVLGGASGQGVGSVTNASWMNVPNYSAACWVKPANTNSFRGYFSRYQFVGGGFILGQTSSGGGGTFLWDTVSTGDNFLTGGPFIPGNIYYVVGTYNTTSGVARLYTNGGLAGEWVKSGASGGALTQDMQFGGYAGGNYSQANLGPCAFFDQELTAKRIASQYAAGLNLLTHF